MALPPVKPDSSSDDYVMSQDKSTLKTLTVSIKINEILINMIIDTGASIDILNETTYIQQSKPEWQNHSPTIKRLFACGSKSQLHVLGSFEATIIVKHNQIASMLVTCIRG